MLRFAYFSVHNMSVIQVLVGRALYKKQKTINYEPTFKYRQRQDQGIKTFAEELFLSHIRENWDRDEFIPVGSIVVLYKFATGLKDDRLSDFAVRWIRKRRGKRAKLFDLVYWVQRERLKNYKIYPISGKRRKWRRC